MRTASPGAYTARMAKGDEERAARLAQALRDNLLKRKAQARGAAPAKDRGAD